MLNYLPIGICVLFLGCAESNSSLQVVPSGSRFADASLDIRGKTITTYIAYQVEKNLSKMQQNQILEVITDRYPAIESDLRAWSRQRGYPLLEVEKKEGFERYYFQKTATIKNDTKVAIIVSDDGLTTTLSPLGFSLAATLQGADVHIYVQGPAVKMLEKGFKASLPGWQKPFSYFARKQLNEIGHNPPQEKLQQLHELGAHLYLCAPSLDYFGVDHNKLIFNNIPVIEYLTFMEIASDADVQFFLQ